MARSPSELKRKKGFQKIEYTCSQAAKDGLEYCWVDTCCIDKSSSAELSEAINSMYAWYRDSRLCYAYLADVAQASEVISEAQSNGNLTVDPSEPTRPDTTAMPLDTECLHPRLSPDQVGDCTTSFSEKGTQSVKPISGEVTGSRPASTSDTASSFREHLACSRWFTRGWTLQELIAPSKVEFFSSN